MSEPRPRYELVFRSQPERMIRRVSQDTRRRLDRAILALADNPRPHGCLKLTGYDDLWCIRVGDWRILYAIDDNRLIVLVVTIARRNEVHDTTRSSYM